MRCPPPGTRSAVASDEPSTAAPEAILGRPTTAASGSERDSRSYGNPGDFDFESIKNAMDRMARGYVEGLVETAQGAAGARPEVLTAVGHYIEGAVTSMITLGVITRAEAEELRERLRESLGSEFGRRKRLRITKDGEIPREPEAEEAARSAYTACLIVPITVLARLHDTAASEEEVAAALAAEYPTHRERIERACQLGFADRVKDRPVMPDV